MLTGFQSTKCPALDRFRLCCRTCVRLGTTLSSLKGSSLKCRGQSAGARSRESVCKNAAAAPRSMSAGTPIPTHSHASPRFPMFAGIHTSMGSLASRLPAPLHRHDQDLIASATSRSMGHAGCRVNPCAGGRHVSPDRARRLRASSEDERRSECPRVGRSPSGLEARVRPRSFGFAREQGCPIGPGSRRRSATSAKGDASRAKYIGV